MKPATHLDVAKENMLFLGRRFVRTRHGDFWEDETRTLPWPWAGLRRRYRAFADKHIRPKALAADRDLSLLDKKALFSEYAKEGFASELMPPPIGKMSPRCATAFGFHIALRVEELFAACGGIGLMLAAHDLGVIPLLLSGSPRVLWKWVIPVYKRLNRGEPVVFAFAITEPGAGSDVEDTEGALKARVVTRARKTSGGYVLNGRKVFISDGGIADYVTVFACLGDEGLESWTCFLVERGMEGFSLGRKEKKMGQRAGDATELIFEDVFVPDDHLIGGERAGWAMNKAVLNTSRPAVGGIALGIARGAFEHCLEFCRHTRLGNRPLVEYQDVQIELAEMFTRVLAARSMVWNSGRHYFPPLPAVSDATKVFASDTAIYVCEKAMEIMGDHAYVQTNGVEKALRDARLTQIYEGTNQINRLGIVEDLWDEDIIKSSR